ncbi:hypothetical protein F383_25265 [Gossypium arboreum]|uniref:Uncharacterized protein n=1 Tax=Gossypium arboreum TaxID=29729 RepID=A0A0B0P142_GOSAR|nr:hypothetical protein F383_25265 [Gossypium arboreum]
MCLHLSILGLRTASVPPSAPA